MDTPLVSVIIPTHNAENTIDRCLESVVNQTYKNLQVICCDDCSKDKTWEKLLEWHKKDLRIEVIKNDTNMRAAYTRNQCISKAIGTYIAQIDDDDYMVLERIEKQVAFLEEHHEYDFVSSGAYLFDENGIWGQASRPKGYSPLPRDFLWNSCFINPTVTFRTTSLKSVNGYRVAKETRRAQDYDLFMRLYAHGYKGFILPELLTYYYRGEKSYPKCKYRYRIDEAKIRYKNFRKLGLMPKGMIYVIKPLIVGLLPIKFIESFKKRNRSK